jgi:ATP-binding cassette subfamily F protein 3
MEALSTKTLELGGGRHRLFYGGYGYYLGRVSSEPEGGGFPSPACAAAPSLPEAAPETLSAAPPQAAPETPPSGLPKTILLKAGSPAADEYLSMAGRREQEKQRQALIRRLRRQEEEILKSLEALEAEKTRLETELGKPEVYSNGEKARAVKAKLDETAAAAEAKLAEWEAKAAELAAGEEV